MSQGGLPVERFLTVNVKLIMSEGQLKKKHNKFLPSPGRGQINFCGYCRIRIPFTVPELLIQGEIRYTFAATSDYECLADDWICASTFNLFPCLHYVLS